MTASVENLFMAGTAVFCPTWGWSNSILTLLALGYRLPDHLQGELAVSSRAVERVEASVG